MKYCSECGNKLGGNAKYCFSCGTKIEDENKLLSESDENDEEQNDNDFNSENGIIQEDSGDQDEYTYITQLPSENKIKKIFKGVGIGGLVASGGFLYISFIILQFLFVALAGLSMIGLAISLFSEGSIILGLVALFIGTPLAIGLASYLFIFWLILMIFSAAMWGVSQIFGFDVSFDSVWSGIWLVIKILILGGIVFSGISSFVEAVKNKDIASFFKESWWGILLFLFLFWLFF